MKYALKIFCMSIFFMHFLQATINGDTLNAESIKARVMSERNLRAASPAIETMAQKALDDCGITENVIILESDENGGKVAYSFRRDEQAFFVFASESEHNQAIKVFAAYHESGHLYHDHARQNTILPNMLSAILAISASCLFCKSCANFKEGKSLVGWAYQMGILFLCGMLNFPAQVIHKMRQEREADLFACQQLVKNRKSDIILAMINDFEAQNVLPNFVVKAIALIMGIPHSTPMESLELLKGCLNKDNLE